MATTKIQGIKTTRNYQDLEVALAAAKAAVRGVVFTLTAESTPQELQTVWDLMDAEDDLKRRLDAERRSMIHDHCSRRPC